MESFYMRQDYKDAKKRMIIAIDVYESAADGYVPFDTLEEMMIASYEMSRLIKVANTYVFESRVREYTLSEAIQELDHQFLSGTLRGEAAALETLSRIIYKDLPGYAFVGGHMKE
jgi:hypothetical protein